jgi:hypothetical protein
MARLRQILDGRYGGPLTHRSYTTPWDTTSRKDRVQGATLEFALSHCLRK